MQTITTIGLDIAKSVFQVHGVDAGGQVIVRRQLKRRYVLTFFQKLSLFQKLSPCLVGIEACGSVHHWSRELQALGHTVRLIPPAYVKPLARAGIIGVPSDGAAQKIITKRLKGGPFAVVFPGAVATCGGLIKIGLITHSL